MDYEKKYKEALDRARQFITKELYAECNGNLVEYIFPELKEVEDERIRKELISFLKSPFVNENITDEKVAPWIAWLEKQKEYESTDFEYVWDRTDCGDLTSALDKYSEEAIINMCHAWYDKGIELERKSWLEKQGEKPRYSIGDVLCDKSCTTLNKDTQPNFEIVDIRDGMYICDKGSLPISQQDEYELVAKKIEKISQRMISAEAKEALYDKPTDEEMKELLRTEYEKGRADTIADMKSSWSEEDEHLSYWTIHNLTELKNRFGDNYGDSGKCIDWIKQLKQRIGG